MSASFEESGAPPPDTLAAAAIAAQCKKVKKTVNFADDVGKTLTETRIFRSEDPSNVGDLIPVSDEKELLHKSTNAWRPKCLKQAGTTTVHELQAKLDADRAASSETKSWADLADEDDDFFG